jgi:3',5'-cyclic AMP phosphodiesterase CpdA
MGEHPGHATGGAIVLAHLSDPHLTTPVVDQAWRLGAKRFLSYLSWSRKRRYRHLRAVLDAVVEDIRLAQPDHWLVSGDLTHLGLAQESADAADWLRELAPPERVSVIAGNHDRLVEDDWAATRALWRPFFTDPCSGVPAVTRIADIAIISVNTAVPTRLLFADGRVGASQLESLEEVLKTLREQGAFRLVLMHHSPLVRGHAWRKRLRDAAAFGALLDRVGAELVLHGHGHQDVVATRDTRSGVLPIVGAPSASMRGQAGWNRLLVARTADGWKVTRTAHRHAQPGVVTTSDVTWQLQRAHAAHVGEVSSRD